MKKFYFLLVAMLVSFAAQAWTVKFTNPDNWTSVACYTFNPETNGGWPGKTMTKDGDVWTYTGTGTPGKIIFNNNGGGKQTANLDFEDGATYDMNGVVGAKMNSYSVYFDNSKTNWADVYVYTFSPEVNGAWPGKKLTANADGLYEWVYEATSDPDFGGIIFNNNNGGQTKDLTYEVGATYDLNGKVGEEVVIDYTTWYVNVMGDFNDWMDNGLQPNAEGIVTHENLAIGNGKFKIKVWNGTDVWYSNGLANPVDTEITLSGDAGDMTIEGAKVGETYNVTFDCKNGVMTIVKVGGPTVNYPELGLLIQGDETYGDVDNLVDFERTDNVYTMTLENGISEGWTIMVDDPEADLPYCFMAKEGETQEIGVPFNGWYMDLMTGFYMGMGMPFNTPTDKPVIITVTLAEDWQNENVPAKIEVSFKTGVEAVAAENTAVYYNLNGVRVAKPENGLFVKVQGNKTSKVAL